MNPIQESITETITLSIVFIFFLIGVFLTWFFIHKAKTKERLLLIEKGIDISQISQESKLITNFPWLKIGIVALFMGLGLAIGSVPSDTALMIGFIFIFGGIGMVIANYFGKPKATK
jgi:uncharacterized membrane protein